MNQDEIKALFDQQASGYDTRWEKTQPLRSCLYLLLESAFADVPAEAEVLCVGAGTGAELAHLAGKMPGWRFTAVEPSGAMLEVCRKLAVKEGFSERCVFHEGYLDSLGAAGKFDVATCFLVSQFILDREARTGFFREILESLKPGGVLASTDLASDIESPEYEVLLRAWMNMMSATGTSPEGVDRMRRAYANDVGVLPPSQVASIIHAAGFDQPVPFFQAGLIYGWLSRRAASHAARR